MLLLKYLDFILGRLFVPLFLRFSKNVTIGKNVKFNSFPYVQTTKLSEIKIGNNVTINSSNYGYHLNMHSPVKLVADIPGAKISIGENTIIHGSCIHAHSYISIGKNVMIAANCQIIDSNAHSISMDNPSRRFETYDEYPKKITIENDVWVGANCIILKGVKIGQGSIISAGSVINSDIPEKSIAGGNPCKVLKTYK